MVNAKCAGKEWSTYVLFMAASGEPFASFATPRDARIFSLDYAIAFVCTTFMGRSCREIQ